MTCTKFMCETAKRFTGFSVTRGPGVPASGSPTTGKKLRCARLKAMGQNMIAFAALRRWLARESSMVLRIANEDFPGTLHASGVDPQPPGPG